MRCDELCRCAAELNESRTNDRQDNGESKQGGGEVALTAREMIDAPPGGEAPVLEQRDREAFTEAGVLEKSRSLHPGERLPPQPLVKTLEEVAEKLGVSLRQPPTHPHEILGHACNSCSPP